ncbi:MAG: 30S ribosomal protein S16 [Deltaproteobacteria bacterium]|nr:30S ribosomal protein S16 [Deltaproteobacteria bacterium]MBW2308410.1 30S ribosomal protein S16 [Deltaproteobacteria bacterium]
MALKIRLSRMGVRNRPFYRVVLTDSRSRRDGRFIEKLGIYDPTKEPLEFDIDRERALYWIQRGAKPSETVRSLMKRFGLIRPSIQTAAAQTEKTLEDIPSEQSS